MIAASKLRPSDRLLQALHNRDIPAAITIGNGILQESPTDWGVMRTMARLFTELESSAEAAPLWTRLHIQDPADIEACFHCLMQEQAGGADADEAVAAVCTEGAARLAPVLGPLLRAPPVPPPSPSIRHVAIAGVSYCGSTLFDRLLGGLPGVRSIGESHWLIKTYENRVAAAIDFADPTRIRMLSCTVCGPRCKVLTLDFRTRLAADRSKWYFRIAQQLGTDLIVSADKNPSKLIENDPLLRMDMLVLFKSPLQAWVSQLDKLPKGMQPEFYVQELEKYIPQWCRSYEAFLHQFKPAGKVAFLSFDSFVERPKPILQAICAALNLPFDEGVLVRTVPGHAIGGNGRAMARLRDNDYAVNILPLDPPGLTAEQTAIINADTRINAIHDEMMTRFRAVLAEYEPRATETPRKKAPAVQSAPPVGNRIPEDDGGPIRRFALPTVHAIHHEGIFGDFADNVRSHIVRLEQKGTPSSKVKAGFFKHLLETVDSAEYRKIQLAYLKPGQADPATIKYLDPIQWFDVKLNSALRMELHKRPPMSILELEPGPGHFVAIGRYFGHHVVGAGPSLAPELPSRDRHLFEALSEIFGARRAPLAIEAFRPLADLGERFDLVASFMPTFAVHGNGSSWTTDAWRFLVDDIRMRLLKPDGAIFLQFSHAKLTDDLWTVMASMASWSIDVTRSVYLDTAPVSVRATA